MWATTRSFAPYAQRRQAFHAGEQRRQPVWQAGAAAPVKIESNDGTTTRTHWSGWLATILPVGGKYGNRQVDIIAHGAMQFLKATETKIELQENQRSDQIIDALIQEVIFPPALAS